MCTHPLRIKNPLLESGNLSKKYIDVPCGKCVECRKAKQNEWYQRILAQSIDTLTHGGQEYYYTLTYNDKFCPRIDSDGQSFKCFSKKYVKNFLVYLKKFLKKSDIKLKYIIVSEYGTKTIRPHHHALFFLSRPLNPSVFKKLVEEAWSIRETKTVRRKYARFGFSTQSIVRHYGFIKPGANSGLVSLADLRPVQYVAKYITKQFDDSEDYVKSFSKSRPYYQDEDLTVVPFHFQSHGFGIYILQLVDKDLQWSYIDPLKKSTSPTSTVKFTAPLYIQRHILYDKYINKNGNISYKLNKLGINFKIKHFDSQYQSVYEKLLDFRFLPKNYIVDSPCSDLLREIYEVSNLYEFIDSQCGIDTFIDYYLVRRGLPSAWATMPDVRALLKLQYEDFPFVKESEPFVDRELELYCALYDSMCNFKKYKAYVQVTEDYNRAQRVRSEISKEVPKLHKVLSFKEFICQL